MKSTVILRSLAAAAAVLVLAVAVRSATANVATARATSGLVDAQQRIRIMITPQVPNNDVDLSKTKAIDVAIVYERSWSFGDIDAQTVDFAGAFPTKSATLSKDWDNDGEADRTYYFAPKDLKLTPTDTMACLKLETINKQKLSGCDKVKVIPAKSGSR